MCGIVGFTGRNRPEVLAAMCDSIVHRGPDSAGYYREDDISLGMRRLAIVDIKGGTQPIFNEKSNIVAVFNGEIYDHLMIRKDLQLKHCFSSSHSDSEIVVHSYEEYGYQWASRVNGMFATAIWDKDKQCLLLYRDRLGKKPLYYCECEGELVFASEIKAILCYPGVSRELDYAALGCFFAMKNISAPRTIYKHIKQVLPGHFVKWEKGDSKSFSYWNDDFSTEEDISFSEAVIEIQRLLRNSVHLRMNCDVPFGAYLSGGVDSSAIVALMSQESKTPIKTFCLGYKDKRGTQFQGKEEDISYARIMAKRLGTEHHELFIDSSDFANVMPKIIRAFDEPFSGTVSTFFLSELIGRYVKVALSGDGADELFASYLPQRLSYPINNYLRLCQTQKYELIEMNDDEKESLHPFNHVEKFSLLKNIASESISDWREKLAVFPVGERKKLLRREIFPAEAFSSMYAHLDANISKEVSDVLVRNLAIDQRELLPNQILPFVDRLSMAHSVEVRCPFLDYRLVQFVNRLPGNFKIYKGTNKFILKKAMEGLIPNELLNRPKEGFVQPIYSWMHSSLKGWITELLEELPPELFVMEYLNEIKHEFYMGNMDYNAKIWNLACFSMWWKSNKM